MINYLKIKNFILFEDVIINFQKQTNGLVGETGSGKSIIFSAIEILCGQRNQTKNIMQQKNFYELEMEIINLNQNNQKKIQKIIPNFQGDKIIVYRKLDKNGKSEIKINEELITLNDLKYIMLEIIDIHNQTSGLNILKEDNHIEIIDQLISPKYLTTYQKDYHEFLKKQKKVKYLNDLNDQKEEKLELLEFQVEKLAILKDLEDEEELIKKKEYLANFQKNQELNSFLENKINESYQNFQELKDNLTIFSPQLQEKIQKTYLEIEEISFEYAKSLTVPREEEDLEQIEEQLHLIKSLKRKYKLDYEQLIQKYTEIQEEIRNLNNISNLIVQEEKELNKIKENLQISANLLSSKRKEIIQELTQKINIHFQDLKMENTIIKFECVEVPFQALGSDDIKIYIKTNKGQEYDLIDQIASGGEKSRIMLILKIAMHEIKPKQIYLLDEIDSGISSQVALLVAKKILDFSQNTQTLIISHTIQVISKLNHLYEVSKKDVGNYTRSTVKELNQQEQEKFIAQYLKI